MLAYSALTVILSSLQCLSLVNGLLHPNSVSYNIEHLEKSRSSPDFTQPGSYASHGIFTITAPLIVTLNDSKASKCTLQVFLSQPKLGFPSATSLESSDFVTMLPAQEVNSHPSIMSQGLSSVPIMPVVLLVNGFQLSSSFYTSYVQRLCSWGYAVLQYDLPGHVLMKKLIPDDQEAALLPQLLRWASSAQSSHPNKPSVDVMSNNLYHLPKIDLSSIVLAGHSRGGKLAALMLAQANQMGINVKAAALIDPVDMNLFTRILGYPSAVDALRGKGAKALLIGAGVTGSCNPPKEGYHKFWEVLYPLSWQGVIQKAGHMQVTDASGALGWVLDQLCHVGEGMSHESAMELVSAQLVAWLELQLRPGPDTEAGIQAFQSWVESKVKEGALTFKIK